jgi:putative ABC transport system ATP-binding protein
MLFQSGNLLEHLTVIENVEIAQRIAGGSAAHSPASILDDLGLLERARARPSQLSGGELARAGLAVALANAPRVILADEPTGELDATNAQRLAARLRERARAGTAIVVVTHSDLVAGEADRVVSLFDGRVTP